MEQANERVRIANEAYKRSNGSPAATQEKLDALVEAEDAVHGLAFLFVSAT